MGLVLSIVGKIGDFGRVLFLRLIVFNSHGFRAAK
jgi:hypothetical protein